MRHSFYNEAEAQVVWRVRNALLREGSVLPEDIGVLTWYDAQNKHVCNVWDMTGSTVANDGVDASSSCGYKQRTGSAQERKRVLSASVWDEEWMSSSRGSKDGRWHQDSDSWRGVEELRMRDERRPWRQEFL